VWALIAFSAIVPGCVADLTQAKGQETVSASETSVLLAGEPLFAAIFAAVTLGELLGTMGYVGGALIIFGALVAGDVFTKKKTA
jgi:drug/metabolite transporter (DMT)-like permease